MPAETLLSRLEKVRRAGPGRWLACCPAHDDRTPSLSVREQDDGRVLLHCFGGCDVYAVLRATGLEMDALYPERAIQHASFERRPFPAADVLRAVAFEALIVVAAVAALRAGHPLSEADVARLAQASARIQDALDAAGVRYG